MYVAVTERFMKILANYRDVRWVQLFPYPDVSIADRLAFIAMRL
jgi:hypothetical protein